MRKLLTILFFVFSLGASAQLTVNAGADTVLTISPAGRYNLTNTDTGYLHSSVSGATGSVSYSWLQLSGPAPSILENPEGGYSPVYGLIVGVYTFRVTATDANGSASDDVKLTVQPCGTGAITMHVTPGSDGGIFLNCTGIQPGSVFYIDSAVAPSIAYIYIYNIKGAPGCNIKTENYGDATLPSGIDMDQHSDWGEISGSGPLGSTNRRSPRTNILCGLHFKGHFKEVFNGTYHIYNQESGNGNGPAIHIHGATTNIYIHNVEVYKKKYGLQDKDDDFDNCDSLLNYPNGVQKGHVIMYNWFHYTESQGMYIFNTAPNNQYTHIRAKNCPPMGTVYGEPGRGLAIT
jgi:hypothetical protein